jgi:alkylation response protein AidB-like acyl-CoA dehydrogenase
MDFHLTEEQKTLESAARDFLKTACPSSFVLEMEEDEKGYTQELWQEMADLGWMGLVVPEEYEGVGGDFLDLVVMLKEMGGACLPGPFFSTVVLGCQAILKAGNASQRNAYLPKIACGDTVATLALTEPETTKYDPYLIAVKAAPRENDFVIKGTKLFVPDAHVADYLICVARTSGETRSREGITLFLVDAKSPGIEVAPIKTIAGEKLYEVVFNDVSVSKENMLGKLDEGGNHLESVLQMAAVGKCAEMVGGAEKVLEMATEYAKEREQFGRQIGSFQAVQHHCANMLIAVEGSKYVTYKAAWMLSRDIPCGKLVAAAKASVGEAYKRVVGLGHQVMGATACIVEHDMPLYSRRAKAAEFAFGDGSFYRSRVAQELGLC